MSDTTVTGLTSPAFVPAHALADAIRRKEVSSAEVVDVFLERIDWLNPTLNAFLTVCGDEARAAARAADDALSAGGEIPRLLGVPSGIKDLMQTKGIRTTFGSLIYRDFVPDVDDVAVARVRDAGAVIVGKTNTCEFGMLLETTNRLGEDARNPWDPSRTTGGSSGGSAAAVAAGLTPLATGTDSAGSVSNPSGLNGVLGLKTSLGRVPIVPYTGDSLLLNTYGPIARSVKDAALLLSVIAGHDPRDPMAIRGPVPDFVAATEPDAEPRGLRMAWSADMGRFPVDPEVLSIAESGARTFKDLGFPVEAETPVIDEPFEELYLPLYRAETYTVMQQLLADRGDDLHPEVREELELSRKVSRGDYVRAVSNLWRFRSRLDDFFERYDLILTPNCPVEAFPVGEAPTVIGGAEVSRHWKSFLGFTAICNLAGLPAASVPCGFTARGLPAGMLLIGRRGEDAAVLGAAAAFERARPWADAVPDLART
jgi:Asp-tRNA(Asn)/Glu-tRNA(Gln) amidotransferase A subunit family amidase